MVDNTIQGLTLWTNGQAMGSHVTILDSKTWTQSLALGTAEVRSIQQTILPIHRERAVYVPLHYSSEDDSGCFTRPKVRHIAIQLFEWKSKNFKVHAEFCRGISINILY